MPRARSIWAASSNKSLPCIWPPMQRSDAGAVFADLGDGLGVAVTIQHADHKLGNIHALRAGEVLQVFGERGVERYHVFRQAAANRDLLHVDVPRVQKIAAL